MKRSSSHGPEREGASRGSRQFGCLAVTVGMHAFVLGGMALTRLTDGDMLTWVFYVPFYVLAALALAIAGVRGNRLGPSWVGAVHFVLALTAVLVILLL